MAGSRPCAPRSSDRWLRAGGAVGFADNAASVAALGMAAIMLPTRLALRSNPAEAIGIRE
jgi:hypothetical protein